MVKAAAFAATLEYAREAYRILGIEDPPPLPLIIHAIYAKRDHPAVSELAAFTGLSLKTTSRTLGHIRKMGLIELRIDERDTRIKRVTLTRRGVEVEKALYHNLQGLAKRVYDLVI